jgi:hypothetical protein
VRICRPETDIQGEGIVRGKLLFAAEAEFEMILDTSGKSFRFTEEKSIGRKCHTFLVKMRGVVKKRPVSHANPPS